MVKEDQLAFIRKRFQASYWVGGKAKEMEDRRVNEEEERKRLPENPAILENAPWYFTVWFICKLTVCQPIAASNVNNRQSRFTQNVGTNLGLIQGVRLMYLSLIQVTFFFQNNQQANGIEGEQQSENVQEVIKNSN